MLKPAALLTALLALAACSGNTDTSVTLSASEASAASTSAPAAAANQTLSSADGKISITTAESQFTDRLSQAGEWVDASEAKSLVLLQRDDNRGITLSVSAHGAPKTDAAAYFSKLTGQLKADQRLQNLDVGAATDQRMNYRFSYQQDGVTLNESCIALYGSAQIYVACASSDSAEPAQLADTLKDIRIQP